MAQPDSEDIKSEKRQLDIIRRERDSIQRLLNQARLANLNQEVQNLIQNRQHCVLIVTQIQQRRKSHYEDHVHLYQDN